MTRRRCITYCKHPASPTQQHDLSLSAWFVSHLLLFSCLLQSLFAVDAVQVWELPFCLIHSEHSPFLLQWQEPAGEVMLGWMAGCQPLQEGKEPQGLQPYDACDPSVFIGPVLLPRQARSGPPAPPKMSSSSGSGRSVTEARALKIHSEAERRRRERINAHLTTLRRMVPDTRQVRVILRFQCFTCQSICQRFLNHFSFFIFYPSWFTIFSFAIQICLVTILV